MSDSSRTIQLPDGHMFEAAVHLWSSGNESAQVFPVQRYDGTTSVCLSIRGVQVKLSPRAWLAVIAELTEVIADLPIDLVVA